MHTFSPTYYNQRSSFPRTSQVTISPLATPNPQFIIVPPLRRLFRPITIALLFSPFSADRDRVVSVRSHLVVIFFPPLDLIAPWGQLSRRERERDEQFQLTPVKWDSLSSFPSKMVSNADTLYEARRTPNHYYGCNKFALLLFLLLVPSETETHNGRNVKILIARRGEMGDEREIG